MLSKARRLQEKQPAPSAQSGGPYSTSNTQWGSWWILEGFLLQGKGQQVVNRWRAHCTSDTLKSGKKSGGGGTCL